MLALAAPPGAVLELCAGVGHIGLVVARETSRRLVQVDVDARACELARRNAASAGIRSDVRCGEFDDVLHADERFAVVIADPPYIASSDTDRFGDDPDLAIDGGDDGLAVARRCLATIARHLVDDGVAVLQLGGPEQAAELAHELGSYGLEGVERRTYGVDRALVHLRRC